MKASLLIMILTMLLSTYAYAETYNMVQVDKTFLGDLSEKQVTEVFDDPSIEEKHKVDVMSAKVGDVIKFKNRDEVTHNVSGWKGSENVFDVKLQEPGQKNDRDIVFNKKGEYTIQCAIHPKMKLKIKVD
jgi:plastocyanin